MKRGANMVMRRVERIAAEESAAARALIGDTDELTGIALGVCGELSRRIGEAATLQAIREWIGSSGSAPSRNITNGTEAKEATR